MKLDDFERYEIDSETIAWYEVDSDELVALFCYGAWAEDEDKIGLYNVYISPYYRGKSLCKELVNIAIKEYDCTILRVNKKNDAAYHIYEQANFIIVGQNEKDYYMELDCGRDLV